MIKIELFNPIFAKKKLFQQLLLVIIHKILDGGMKGDGWYDVVKYVTKRILLG
jgi:hypothetical protein